MQLHRIDTDKKLNRLLDTEWSPLPETLAFDLEADFDHYHYGKKLCLLQFASLDTAWLIDPQGIRDISPVVNLLENPHTVKVMYSGDGDIMLLKDVLSCQVRNVWDTQIAAKILGEENIGLPHLVPRYLGKDFPKNSRLQKSDWTLRPLSQEQLEYAAGDVKPLLPLRQAMENHLSPQQKEEMAQRMKKLEGVVFRNKPRPWETMKGAKRLPPEGRIRLKYLYNVREMAGERADLPVFQILPHEALCDLSADPQVTADLILNHRRAHRALSPFRDVLTYALGMAEIEISRAGKKNKRRR